MYSLASIFSLNVYTWFLSLYLPWVKLAEVECDKLKLNYKWVFWKGEKVSACSKCVNF